MSKVMLKSEVALFCKGEQLLLPCLGNKDGTAPSSLLHSWKQEICETASCHIGLGKSP